MAIKIKITDPGTDPKKKVTKIKATAKPSSTELEAANRFAKDFAVRRGLLSGEETHTGGKIPQFVEGRTGQVIPTGQPEPPLGTLSNKVPAYVTSLEWDDKSNLPYYIDEKTGDTKYVAQELFHSPRFKRAVPAAVATTSIVKR